MAGSDLGEVRGAPESSAKFTAFYEAMVAKGYSSRPVLLGQSLGGLMLLCWVFRNPEKVKAFAGIYPVCSLTSWPLQHSQKTVLRDYGLSEKEIVEQLGRFNPLANMSGLAENGIPLFLLPGDADHVVPLEDNSALLKEAYQKAGGSVELKIVPRQGTPGGPRVFQGSGSVNVYHQKK